MKTTKPSFIGLVTGLLMIILSIGSYMLIGNIENNFQIFTYVIYIIGILYSISIYNKQKKDSRLKILFQQGFQCFIVITLLMVIFEWICLKMIPGFTDSFVHAHEIAIRGIKDKTQAEIENQLVLYRKYIVPMRVSAHLFGYLLIGAITSLLAALFFNNKKTAN